MPAKRRSRRGKGSAYAAAPKVTLTSVPTGRAAYTDTREWLLEQHGPVCAYCESVIPIRSVTLDHVTPRRGQTAYDRRDNLVLCCKACNAIKKDKPLLVFLLGSRKRVIAMYKYGQHLSHQLVEMVKDLLPPEERPVLPSVPHHKRVRRKTSAEIFGDHGRGGSPYLEEASSAYVVHVPRAVQQASVTHKPVVTHKAPAKHKAVKPKTPVAHKAPVAAAAAPTKKRTRRGGRGRKLKP